jgi:hypothetical protein
MADERARDETQAAPEAPPQGQDGPRPLRLRVVSDGSRARLVDAESGQEVLLDAHTRVDVACHPGKHGAARVVAVFAGVEVEHEGDSQAPYEMHGLVLGGRPGPLPAGVSMAPPDLAPQAPAFQAAAPEAPAPQAPGRVDLKQAMEFNRRLNEEGRAPGR